MDQTQDNSRRFVLPQDSPYLKNMAALWASDPRLAAAIESIDEAQVYATEPSQSGAPTLAITPAAGPRIYLHSRYEPLQEAHRLAEAIPTDRCVAFWVQGFGLGYHVKELFEHASEESIIAVFEPDLAILRTAIQLIDCSKMLSSRRLMVFHKPDKSELFARLTPFTAMLSMGLECLTHTPSVQVQPLFHRQMQLWMEEFVSYSRTTINTLIINGRRTAENLAHNIGWYAAAPGVERLKDRYHACPAIIVSAGPSLRKNRHLLHQATGKAVIIAVQTTLGPLVDMGIEPQFATSLDYHDACTTFFERLPAALRTELVAEPKASSRIFALHPGPLCLLGNHFAESLLREMQLGKMHLTSGATVAHLAYYLAEHLGCDPIIFVGQDLGFSDGLHYLPGTSYDDVWRPETGRFCTAEMKQWQQIVRERNILRKIPDIHGGMMYTEDRLFTYLQQFERDFGSSTRRIIDATEGGALKRGSEVMTLGEALDKYCTQPLPSARPHDNHAGLSWQILDQCIASLDARRCEAGEIERIAEGTLPLLQQLGTCLSDQAQANRIIARIDTLRARMSELGATYDLVTQLTQLTELQRFQSDHRILATKVDGVERQRRQVARDMDNVRGVMDAAREFQKLMDQVIGELSQSPQLASKREAA